MVGIRIYNMAITNAQQYKQLLAKGGRIGFKGGADMGTVDAKDSKGNVTRAATSRSVNISPSGSVTTSRDDPSPAQEIIGGQSYDVTPDNRKLREDLREEQRQLREIEKKKFIYEPANYPKYTPGYVKFLANLNREPNRRYFVNKVLKGKNATSLLTKSLGLDPEDQLSFSPFDLTEEQFEKAYQDYMTDRLSGKTDAMGNINPSFGRDDGPDQPIIPMTTPDDPGDDDTTTPPSTGVFAGIAPRFAGSIFDFDKLRAGAMDGGRMMMDDDPTGGIMDLESGRQMYFLGKLVKKATRAVKKVAKSPIGKAALLGGAMYFGGGGGKGLASFFGKGSFNPLRMAAAATSDGSMTQLSPLGQLLSKFGMATGEGGGKLTLGGKIGLGFGIPLALDLLGVGKKDDGFDIDEYYRKNSINIADIRNNPYNYLAPRFAADGGLMRTGYQEGGDAEPVAKKTMPLLDMDGMEKDYREDGGFVPIGRMERADDVPARLSKNEFVFTADAVRNAGDGDIDKGAEVMYNMMKNLESGGDVSEESQGLDGAREMFKTSQRLGEVL